MHNEEEYDEMPQKPITLTSLAYQLNEKFQREQGLSLAQKIGEQDFVILVNGMIASGDIIQIKQCLSVPYSAITQADVFSMAPSAACSESAFNSSVGSITPNAANQHLTISSTTASSNVSAKLLKLNSGDE